MKFKQLGLLALSLVGVTSTVIAVDDMQIRNLENRVNALEQRRGANGMINPPARPVVKDGRNVWVQAEALFMQATEDGLAYTIETNNNEIDTNTGLDGRVKNVDYDWSWGFRAGLGYNFDHDGWDALLNWTWFRARESDNEGARLPDVLAQTYSAYDNGSFFVSKSHARSHLHFNLLDFELGREFFVSKWLTLRPHIGARGGWVSRTFSMEYKGQAAIGRTLPFSEFEVKMKDRFRAGGARAGLDSQWGLGSGWSFFGQFALSLLYGTQRLHQIQDLETNFNESRVVDVHNKWRAVRAMTDLAAGLRWDRLFCNDLYRIRLQLGWEQHMFFGFNKDMNFTSPLVSSNGGNMGKFISHQGDLAVSGISFQARFDF